MQLRSVAFLVPSNREIKQCEPAVFVLKVLSAYVTKLSTTVDSIVKGSWDMVSHGGFIAYYRVSTGKQARSGLGIEAQRQAVATYLNGGNWRIIAEFTEVESGKRSDRPALDKALAAARVHQVPLVVAKVDLPALSPSCRVCSRPASMCGSPIFR
jgi:hypothetical protein